MKWKELMTRKRLLFSLVAVATIATSFVLYATMHTTTTPMSGGNSISASPTDTPGEDLQQALGITGSGSPSGGVTPNQTANNSQVRQGLAGTGLATPLYDGSLSIQLADNSNNVSRPAMKAETDQVVHGSNGKGSGKDPKDFTPILLANNDYPEHDRDFQALESHVSVGGGPESIVSGKSSGDLNEPSTSEPQTSHTPEPSSMLLLGSALVGLAVFRRKLRKP